MAELKIWVVSVSYRSAQLMVDCLRSIESERATPGVNLRAVVVDNASGDYPHLLQAVAENGWSPWVSLIDSPRNGGFGYGNNLGIRLAIEQGADYLLLLNPDTEIRPRAIATWVAFMQSHPQVAIAGPSFENRDGTEWPMAFRYPSIGTEFCAALGIGLITRLLGDRTVARRMPAIAQPVDWVSGAAMMVRAQLVAAIGGFDENYFLYFEETDLCFRAARAGFATWYFPESRVMHIMGQSTGMVIESWSKPKRLPPYWFESRRRYLAGSLGTAAAMLADLLVLLAYPVGYLKQILLGRAHTTVPCYLRDFWRHSIVRLRNRQRDPIRTYVPGRREEPLPRPAQSPASDTPLG
ncbi:MAG TPA: glycosyltransferase family 2 protein [Steroidobacteraceae bacterium]|nr:glycosyltransferase family 2 protein [Steroidobacteraceae bacterium]